jgi:hypothetical protein
LKTCEKWKLNEYIQPQTHNSKKIWINILLFTNKTNNKFSSTNNQFIWHWAHQWHSYKICIFSEPILDFSQTLNSPLLYVAKIDSVLLNLFWRNINIYNKYKDFELEKYKKKLPSMNFQNGAQIQDGRQNVFIV